ncbi:MAG: glycosyltransferase family 2 protein [Chitinophagaceae bacterium]|nr:glycosyltransferase family 2 protein [Chitinophagaceae bacterium]
MIYIIIPVFNRIQFTLACLESLRLQTYTEHMIIVVNDGSSDDTTNILAIEFPGVKVLEGDGQLWWSASTNLGVECALSLSASHNDFILTLNNDLVVKENYLQELISAANKFTGTLIGSLSYNVDAPDTIHYTGTRWNSRTATYRPATDINTPISQLVELDTLLPTNLLPGRGTLIPVSVFKKIGLYDHKVFPQYMGDEDFSLRARKEGYKLGVSARAAVYSHIHETGLTGRKKNFRYYINFYTSIKSYANLSKRWSWAKRHANVHPYLYFTLDVVRITMGLISRG